MKSGGGRFLSPDSERMQARPRDVTGAQSEPGRDTGGWPAGRGCRRAPGHV